MKFVLLVFLFFYQTVSSSDVISKWIDAQGRLHYGDDWTVEKPVSEQSLVIDSTFDDDSYKAALRRYAVYEKEIRDREKKLREQEKKKKRSARKRPLNDAEKYDLYLEKQEEERQKELQRKRDRRAGIRRRWKMDCNDSRYAGKKACR